MIVHLADNLRARFPFTVEDLMTTPAISVDVDDRVVVARAVMQELHIHHVAVVRDGELRGVVSSRDLLRTRTPEPVTVADVMTTSPYTARPRYPLSIAADFMVRREVSCLPVLDEDRLVGMVTLTDFVECARLLSPSCRVAQVMTPTPLVTVSPDSTVQAACDLMLDRKINHLLVLDHTAILGLLSDLDVTPGTTELVRHRMTRQLYVAAPDLPVAGAAHRMLSHRIGALPVIDAKHQLVGIITRRDLLRAVAAYAAGRRPGDATPSA